MEKDLAGDLPPPYCKVALSSENEAEDVEHGSEPLVGNSFESKNSRVVFIQKVLSIFLMQTLAVDLVFEIFLYFDITNPYYDVTRFLVASFLLYLISLILMLYCDQARNKAPYNYIILVYQPLALSILVASFLGLYSTGEFVLRMMSLAWKAYVFTCPAILLYSVFSLDSKHEFKLRNCVFIATGIFIVTYICSLPYAKRYWRSFDLFYMHVAAYPTFLYILYDIVAMTRNDYRLPMTPADYANGAVNLSFDFFYIIKDFIKRQFSCCVKQ